MASEPNTVTMNVSLPGPLKQFVDGKVSSGVYGSASEFVREAIREKYQRELDRQEAKDVLTAKLLQGLDSGKPIPYRAGYFQKKKAELKKRFTQTVDRKSKKRA
jgi:antitoxin ParD1/3/4